ncbi:hypothetical protein Bca4012_036647 [Brassica carinata]
MWHKMLKLRMVAKLFYQKEVGNGRHISFWFDSWSRRGPLLDLLGPRGIIDMGVSRYATLEEAGSNNRRRRRHRTELLNDIEDELNTIVSKLRPEKEDVSIWRGKSGFKKRFSSKETWLLLRKSKTKCIWACGVWFPQHTSKYAFITWLSIKDRLSTLDRVAKWSQGVVTNCVLCKRATERRSHLFFDCGYSSQIWEYIAKGILGSSYTKIWDEILLIIQDERMEKLSRFCIRGRRESPKSKRRRPSIKDQIFYSLPLFFHANPIPFFFFSIDQFAPLLFFHRLRETDIYSDKLNFALTSLSVPFLPFVGRWICSCILVW